MMRAASIPIGAGVSASVPSDAEIPSATAGVAETAPRVEAREDPRRSLLRGGRWWLAALVITMGWDRAAWLAVSDGGRSTWAWLESASSPRVVLERVADLPGGSPAVLLEACASVVYMLAYAFGRMPVWLVLGVVLVFREWGSNDVSRVRAGLRRGVFVVLTPAIAGIAAELMKLITRRARPEVADGWYRLVPPSGSPIEPSFWSTSGLGLASSHAAVAAGAALAVGAVFPRVRVWMLMLAFLCVFSRVLVGAHFLSDVFVGATLGALAYVGIYAWDRRNNGGLGLREPVGRSAGSPTLAPAATP